MQHFSDTSPRFLLSTGEEITFCLSLFDSLTLRLLDFRSSALFPAIQILLLLGCQLIDGDALGLQLQLGDLLIQGCR